LNKKKKKNNNNNTFYWDSKYKYIVITLFSHPQIAYNLIKEGGCGVGLEGQFTIQGSTIRWTKQQLRHYNTINRIK